MSILIKGIEKPVDCGKCFIGDRTICAKGCPLVEVPEPHGRLIDADELFLEFQTDEQMRLGEQLDYVRETIEKAPTVIEAEVEE